MIRYYEEFRGVVFVQQRQKIENYSLHRDDDDDE